ncbi:MAG TPA: GYF domain-containing protein [Planctomycetaceae bacterium]
MANWYYDESGDEVGPVPPAVMKQRVADGTIVATTRVRREGGDWTTADRIPGLLDGQPAAGPRNEGDATGGLIPYKNAPALIAYYLAIFSLIPCLGLPLGVAAIVLGVLGLKKRKQNPAVSGAAHAWVGIILGGITTLLWGGAIAVTIVGAAANA